MITNFPKTKILATLGPASSSMSKLFRLIEAGVNGFRINFSHGTLEEKASLYRNIKKAEIRTRKRVFIVQDLCGPKIRVGTIQDAVFLEPGQTYTFVKAETAANKGELPLPVEEIFDKLKLGETFFINDGMIEVKVKRIVSSTSFQVTVLKSGFISSHKGVNFPHQNFDFPSLTDKDKEAINFNLEYPCDYIALSFVRKPEDVLDLKKYLKRLKLDLPVISKIEKVSAIKLIDTIIPVSDAIMVARGDLAVEAGFSGIGVLQKTIVAKAIKKGCPVIVATQMLESMISNPIPTRAEITDITNAVLDGADTLMLSGETAMGKYPLQVIRTMRKVIQKTEAMSHNSIVKLQKHSSIYDTVAAIAVEAASSLNSKAIVTPTMSGATTRKIVSLRPDIHVVALTPHEHLARRLLLYRGVASEIINFYNSTDEMIEEVEKALLSKKLLHSGDLYVLTGGTPPGNSGTTNIVRIERL
ncbi:MAG: pyruvate kinase [Candidatus Wallbacteria bacterium]|nr:pyruvate kinase [Candidatus Wallbacteria bacterium]